MVLKEVFGSVSGITCKLRYRESRLRPGSRVRMSSSFGMQVITHWLHTLDKSDGIRSSAKRNNMAAFYLPVRFYLLNPSARVLRSAALQASSVEERQTGQPSPWAWRRSGSGVGGGRNKKRRRMRETRRRQKRRS